VVRAGGAGRGVEAEVVAVRGERGGGPRSGAGREGERDAAGDVGAGTADARGAGVAPAAVCVGEAGEAVFVEPTGAVRVRFEELVRYFLSRRTFDILKQYTRHNLKYQLVTPRSPIIGQVS
jgi:hypothetical protein